MITASILLLLPVIAYLHIIVFKKTVDWFDRYVWVWVISLIMVIFGLIFGLTALMCGGPFHLDKSCTGGWPIP